MSSEIIIVDESVSLADLSNLAKRMYGKMIKGVVDIEKEKVAFGGEYHIEANMKLIDQGSEQKDLWGFNINLNEPKDSWIEYVSLINIRPAVGNRNMEVQDNNIRIRMKKIIDSKII